MLPNRSLSSALLVAFVWLLGGSLGSGCSGPQEDPGRVVPITELPESYRDLWRAWHTQADDWSVRRAEALRDPEVTEFLVVNLVRDMLAGFQAGEITSIGSTGPSRYERARAELVRIGEPATWALAELNAIGNGYGSTIGGEALVAIGREAIPAVRAQLGREEFQARGRAADVLAKLPHARADESAVVAELEDLLANDPEWTVRKRCADALAERALRHTSVEEARRALGRALRDVDGAVRRSAAGGLRRLGDPTAVPALIDYLERCERDADLRGHDAAVEALRGLTGTRAPRTVQAWRDHWRAVRRGTRG